MQLNLTGHHVDITDSMRNYVQEKLARLTRHFDHVTNVHVILSVEKLAEAVNEDMYAAIDALVDKLDRQVIKYKEKLKSHRGNAHNRNPEPVEASS